jgi:hypothetical protein
MKPKTFTAGRIILAVLTIGMTLGLVSWDYKQGGDKYSPGQTDTVPKTKEKKIRNLDDEIDQQWNTEIRESMEKAMQELREAMKQFDGEKMKLELEKSLKTVDMDKLKMELDKAKQEMENAFKNIDMTKLKTELDASLAKVNWDDLKNELEKVKHINTEELKADMDKLREELKQIQPGLEKEMSKLKVQMQDLKVEMKEYHEFVDGLDKEGLINKKEPFEIKNKDGELTINGKKASAETQTKYRVFLEKHKNFTINQNGDEFNINIDRD